MDEGEFFHFYTEEVHGVFFEVVQRVGDYSRYGEVNAFVRLASQATPGEKITHFPLRGVSISWCVLQPEIGNDLGFFMSNIGT